MNKMSRAGLFAAATLALTIAAPRANAVLIDFNGLSELETVTTQFTGVTFTPGFTGTNPLNGEAPFATNTDMRVTSSDFGSGVPGGTGNLLHTFSGWNAELNPPVFTITFAQPISAFSATFHGIGGGAEASTGIFAFSGGAGGTLLGSAIAGGGGTQTLALNALASADTIVVTPGNFGDWVGVDDINYTTAPAIVPESGTLALLGFALAPVAFGLARRRLITNTR